MYDYYLTNDEMRDCERWQNIQIDRMNENVQRVSELMPTNHQKSFCGRAKIVETGNRIYLLSYNTFVCYWDKHTSTFARLWDDYSVTTMKHVNSFMVYLGFNTAAVGGKHWWTNLICNEEYTISNLLNN